MKKLFTSLFLLTLIVSLLCSAPVMAETIVKSFVYNDGEWTTDGSVGQSAECCAGYIAASDKIIQGSDFYYSGKHQDAVERDGNGWTGFNGSNGTITACTRSSVSLSAATYTFSLLTKDKGEMDITLPKISVDGSNYVAPQKVLINSVEQSFSDNKYRYTENVETVLEYSITIAPAGSYIISVQFTSGWRDKFKASTLTIASSAPAAPTYEVSATASNGSVSGTGSYAEGAEVTLTASPNEDYSFTGWSSASGISISGHENNNPLVFTMPTNAVSVTANFAACTKHNVTLTAGANGSVFGGGEFCDGSVTVTATPNSGYRFVNWTNTLTNEEVSTNAEYTFTLSADISLTANFEENLTGERTYTYHAVEDNTGHNTNTEHSTEDYLYLTDGGHYIDFTHYSAIATTCTIKVGFIADGSKEFKVYVNGGQEKSDWTWNTTDGERDMGEFNLSQGNNKISIVPSWTWFGIRYIKVIVNESKYSVTVVNNDTYGTVTAASSNFAGEVVNISVDANPGYFFSGWASDDVTFDDASATSTTFTMPANAVTITANYTASVSNTFTYTAIGSGNISCTTASGTNVSSGTEIELTATPDPDYTFTGWISSDIIIADASANPLVFTMPANAVSVTANFTACTKHNVTLTAGANGSVSGGGEFCDGSVTVTATPNSDYRFVNWTNTLTNEEVSTNAEYTFTLSADISLTANFAQIDNVIITGDVAYTEGFAGDGNGTMNITSVADFDAFNHNVLKFAYSNMSGNHKGKKIFIDAGYSSSASAQATGFGFYYKTEKVDDHVAFCFEVSSGQQVKWQLAATNNEWKYFYFPHAGADSWSGGHIAIFMNGDDTGNYSTWNGQGTHTTYKDGGAFYMSEIAATSITSKPEIASYIYTRDISGAGWGTLCLPMDGAVEGATLFSVAGSQEENSILYIVLQEEPNLVGGQPYIFEKTADELRATMSGVQTPSPATVNGLVGTYVEISPLTPYDDSNKNYILAKNGDDVEFQKVGDNVTVGAYRAYMNLDGVPAYSPSQAIPGRRYIMVGLSEIEQTQEIEDTEDISAVEEVESGKVLSGKILVNGQLYLMYEGKMYDVRGARVK